MLAILNVTDSGPNGEVKIKDKKQDCCERPSFEVLSNRHTFDLQFSDCTQVAVNKDY